MSIVNVNPVVIGVAAAVFGAIGYAIGRPKGRGGDGLALGLLLGVIGLIIIAALKPRQPSGAAAPGPYPPQVMYGTPMHQQPPSVPTPGVLHSVGPQWAPDPSGRHQYRWWNGTAWTEHVSDGGVTATDAL